MAWRFLHPESVPGSSFQAVESSQPSGWCTLSGTPEEQTNTLFKHLQIWFIWLTWQDSSHPPSATITINHHVQKTTIQILSPNTNKARRVYCFTSIGRFICFSGVWWRTVSLAGNCQHLRSLRNGHRMLVFDESGACVWWWWLMGKAGIRKVLMFASWMCLLVFVNV